jgi:ssDNA-binding Zn-finger/Zn-ribbon topoisomerase 1
MFNLADYEPVEVRLEKFIKDHPSFRIATELEVVEASRYIVKAYLYKDASDGVAWATGYAEETVSSRGVNQTSALENCETSAIGRALANAGYAPKGKRPSREEMSKVVAQKPVNPTVADVHDYWTTPVNEYMKVVDAPVMLEKAMENIAVVIGTEEAVQVPQCKHGSMVWKTGHSTKTGKDWAAYQCTALGHAGFEGKCPAVWYVLGSDGKWQPQKARV